MMANLYIKFFFKLFVMLSHKNGCKFEVLSLISTGEETNLISLDGAEIPTVRTYVKFKCTTVIC